VKAAAESLRDPPERQSGVQPTQAALIIGGFRNDNAGNPALETVELFGCTGTNTLILDSYPLFSYLSGAAYFEDEQKVQKHQYHYLLSFFLVAKEMFFCVCGKGSFLRWTIL